jgi:3-methyladenine DNA glycosylase AlkC
MFSDNTAKNIKTLRPVSFLDNKSDADIQAVMDQHKSGKSYSNEYYLEQALVQVRNQSDATALNDFSYNKDHSLQEE